MSPHFAVAAAAQSLRFGTFLAFVGVFVAASFWVAIDASRYPREAFAGTAGRRWCYQMTPLFLPIGGASVILICVWAFSRGKVKRAANGISGIAGASEMALPYPSFPIN